MNSLSLVFERTAISAEIDEDGEPWFNANEVCAALEFGNPWQAISTHVDDEDLQKMEGVGARRKESTSQLHQRIWPVLAHHG